MVDPISIGGTIGGIAVKQALSKGAGSLQDDEEIRRKFENEEYEAAIEELNKSDVEIIIEEAWEYIQSKSNGQPDPEDRKELEQIGEMLKNDGL